MLAIKKKNHLYARKVAVGLEQAFVPKKMTNRQK
jgi:hypothetical protein